VQLSDGFVVLLLISVW